MGLIQKLDQTLYPSYSGHWDDALFRSHIAAHIKRDSVVLDIGAGAGIVAAMNFKGIAGRVCGIDLDPRILDNPYLDEGLIGDAGKIPYPDATFDVAFADNVVEHLDDPVAVFEEIYRVLKPGGIFLFKTPNRTHYMPTIARLTPHSFHQAVNKMRGREVVDTFPTRYRANTLADAARTARAAGLEVVAIRRVEGRPEYLRFSWPTYLVGAAYERIVNAFDWLARFRILLIVTLTRPGG